MLALLLTAPGLSGGERVVAVDPDDAAPRLALTASFEPDSTLRLSVEQTVPLGKAGSGRLAGARATITDGQGTAHEFAHEDSTYFAFVSDARLVAGGAYVLRVEADGSPSASAAFHLPLPVAGFEATAGPADADQGEFEVTVRFQDPPGEGDRYVLNVYSIRPDGDDEQEYFETLDPSIRDESFFETIRGGAGGRAYVGPAFSDALFDGAAHQVRLRVLTGLSGGPEPSRYVAELRVCSQAYFDQIRSSRFSSGPVNPFSEVSAPPSNVEGGLGTVGAFVRQRAALNPPRRARGGGRR